MAEKMISIEPTWNALTQELLQIVRYADEATAQMAWDEVHRMAKHIESLPEEFQMKKMPPQSYFAMLRSKHGIEEPKPKRKRREKATA